MYLQWVSHPVLGSSSASCSLVAVNHPQKEKTWNSGAPFPGVADLPKVVQERTDWFAASYHKCLIAILVAKCGRKGANTLSSKVSASPRSAHHSHEACLQCTPFHVMPAVFVKCTFMVKQACMHLFTQGCATYVSNEESFLATPCCRHLDSAQHNHTMLCWLNMQWSVLACLMWNND